MFDPTLIAVYDGKHYPTIKVVGPKSTIVEIGSVLHAAYQDESARSALLAVGDVYSLAATPDRCELPLLPAPAVRKANRAQLIEYGIAQRAHALILWERDRWQVAIRVHARFLAFTDLGETLRRLPQAA